MKKIGRKNLYYSLLLAAVMMLFLVGYFVWMLPSLYVDYVEEQNLESVKRQHNAFIEQGSYDGVQVKNPAACVSVKIPLEDNYFEVTSKMGSVKVTAVEADMQELLADVQDFIRSLRQDKEGLKSNLTSSRVFQSSNQIDSKASYSEESDSKKISGGEAVKENDYRSANSRLRMQMDKWKKTVSDIFERYESPIEINIIPYDSESELYESEMFKVHYISDHMVVIQAGIRDRENSYTNYMAVENVEDGIVLSIQPVITPEMEEIRPIVMQSLPMLGAVILVLTLIFSQIYSSGIVQPVYKKLEQMNQSLLEENERQEVFMRASSHQLKTPITAALLLLDGMINQIGKYKDTQAYLPKVKEQLLSMRRMVEEILSLNQNRENLNMCEIGLYKLVQSQLSGYSVAAADKQLEIIIEGDQDAHVYADVDILSKILDNLLSNAVNYTSAGAQIIISVEAHKISVWNQGAVIPYEIMEHIFEPFVRGSHTGQSHGLGLYIAAYYAKLTGVELTVVNKIDGVEAAVEFRR